MSLNRYLATYTLIDGVHEHSAHLLISASSAEEARSCADSLTHEFNHWNDGEDEQHPWSYGDGSTASKLRVVREVSEEQFTFAKEVLSLLVYGGAEAGGRSGPVS
jgi:hypothetical protein